MSLDAIGIACKDTQRSMNFYKQLGLSFKEFGEGHCEATSPSGVRIMLDSFDLLKKINPAWEQPIHSGITLAFVQSSPSEVDKLHAQLTQAGAVSIKEPWDAFWGQRYSSVRDPDGNQVDLFCNLEKNND